MKKAIGSKGDGDTNRNWSDRNDCQRLYKGAGRVRNRRKNRNPSHNTITEIGQNTEKSSRDLGRLAVTQTPVKTIYQRRCKKKLAMIIIIIIQDREIQIGHPIQARNLLVLDKLKKIWHTDWLYMQTNE